MHMFYHVMKGIYQFAANLLSCIPAKYYWNRSTSDLVIAKSRRVNFFLKHSVYCYFAYEVKTKQITFVNRSCATLALLYIFWRMWQYHCEHAKLAVKGGRDSTSDGSQTPCYNYVALYNKITWMIYFTHFSISPHWTDVYEISFCSISTLDCFHDHGTGPDLSCFSIYF